ncbi:MAG: hypothetical protein HFE73_10395 [Firmicutes bacterium]|nr:hypothetical protein [Bacillota bacterium]
MNKGFKTYGLAWAVVFVVFQVICFVTPSDIAGVSKFDGPFWAGYIFIDLAFLGQLACAYVAFKEENLRKLFYSLSLITVSYTGLILMLVAGAAVMVIPGLPNWVGIIVCLVILAFTALSVIKAKVAVELVDRVDEETEEKTRFIKSLTADGAALLSRAKSQPYQDVCKKVYEALRYADPVSSQALAELESRITAKFAELKEAVDLEQAEKAEAAGEELIVYIKERNEKCKLMK